MLYAPDDQLRILSREQNKYLSGREAVMYASRFLVRLKDPHEDAIFTLSDLSRLIQNHYSVDEAEDNSGFRTHQVTQVKPL